MYSSHLLESDSALTTGKHTQMTKENSKGMKDLRHASVDPRGAMELSKKILPSSKITLPLHRFINPILKGVRGYPCNGRV